MGSIEFTKEDVLAALATVRDDLRSGKIEDREFDMLNEIYADDCGTRGCIGGHVARVLVPSSWEQEDFSSVYEVIDCVTKLVRETDDLFYGFVHPSVTRGQAADAIDRLLNGDDSWG